VGILVGATRAVLARTALVLAVLAMTLATAGLVGGGSAVLASPQPPDDHICRITPACLPPVD